MLPLGIPTMKERALLTYAIARIETLKRPFSNLGFDKEMVVVLLQEIFGTIVTMFPAHRRLPDSGHSTRGVPP